MIEREPTVLLTGANGFVGRHLAPVLADNGWKIRRALRKRQDDFDDIIIKSVGPATDWQDALNGIDAVVHLAARVHHPGEESAAALYRFVNTEGTLRLARCASHAGVRHFVFISSLLVNGSSTDGRSPFREDDAVAPRGVYGISKCAAESALKHLANETDMQITIIRPPLVYGPDAVGNFRLLVRAIKLGIPLPFGSICNIRAFLSVQNLASFIAHRLMLPGHKIDTFLVADPEQVSTPEFVRRIAQASGRHAHLFSMPQNALRILLKICGRAEASDSLIGSMEVDVSKVASTGWRAPLSLDDGLRVALAPSGSPWIS